MNKLVEGVNTASELGAFIDELSEQYEKSQQFYSNYLEVVVSHSKSISSRIFDLMGYISQQDIIKQRMDRMAGALSGEDALFESFRQLKVMDEKAVEKLITELENSITKFVEGEEAHGGADPKIDGENADVEFF